MKGSDEAGRGPEASGERISSLIEAIGRIGSNLGLDTLLREVVEGALGASPYTGMNRCRKGIRRCNHLAKNHSIG